MKSNDDEYLLLGKAVWAYYRARCMSQTARAIRNGQLPKPWTRNCVDCGEPAEAYDHRNYALPMDVVAVCHRCNLRRGPAELDTEVVVQHLRVSDYMPYQNARLMRLGQSRFRRGCVCCIDGENFVDMHDEEIHEKPEYPIGDMWNARLTINRLSDKLSDVDKDPREILALYISGVQSMAPSRDEHDPDYAYCSCIACQYERAADAAMEVDHD